MPFLRVSRQNGLAPQEFSEAMIMELESADDRRIQVFNYMLIQKIKWLVLITRESRGKTLKNERLFGRLFF